MDFWQKLGVAFGTGFAHGFFQYMRLSKQREVEGGPTPTTDALLRNALDVIERLPPRAPPDTGKG